MTHVDRLSLTAAVGLAAMLLLTAASPQNNTGHARRDRAEGVQLAALFGESDEEKAARLAREQKEVDQDFAITNLNAQVHDLEETVRRLTGQNEVLSHKVDQFDSRIDRMQKDFDYKLCTVTAQQVGGDTASLPCGSGDDSPGIRSSSAASQSSTQSFTDSGASASNAPRTLAPPPGTIGTLPGNSSLPQPLSSTPPAPVISPYRGEFDTGLSLLGKAQYDEARASFRTYADNHPKDSLAPQAIFWVGNIAYVQKDYANAARAFAEEIKKYPSNDRAAESMLKLGQSLIAMGQKKEGCFTLGSLPATYPKAPKATVVQAASAQKAAACK